MHAGLSGDGIGTANGRPDEAETRRRGVTKMTRTNGRRMQLVAIGYADELTAGAALEELERLEQDFMIRRDEIATIVRDERGAFRIETHAVITGERPSWTMLWLTLFATLFFAPVLRMPIGPELGSIVGKVARAGLEPEFAERVREMVAPETSALFVLIERVTPDDVVSALEQFGGTVLQSEIPPQAELVLQETLTGRSLVA
jgi:uncharacterized membrane protein